MAEGDDVSISASLKDDITASLSRIDERMNALEEQMKSLGRTGAKSGREFAGGVGKAGRAADEMGDQARQAQKPVKELGTEAEKTGAKARVGATGLDRFARSAKKANRESGGFGTIFQSLKWAGIVTGLFAIAGGLSALAAGAIIAVGGLAPMVGVAAAIPTLFLAAKLSMLAFTLAAAQLEPTLTRIKNQFTELGPVIAKGGLQKGLDYLANSLTGLSKATGAGLAGIGAEIGNAAHATGDLVKSRPFLDQVSIIFAGLRPIVRDISMGLLALGRALLNIIQGSLPMVQSLADDFRWIAEGLATWTAAQLANGRMAAWLTKAWTIFTRTIGVIVDILVGLFHIFQIGAGYAGDMGDSIEAAAYKFRLWTGSAEGQARINQYFQDSLPALREIGKLLAMAAGGLGKLGANQNVAPLLAQIRTEFAPALGELVTGISGQNGLGPALIDAATALVKFVSALDFSGLTLFVQALAGLVSGIVWIMQNVPGASWVVSALVGAFLAFKLLTPVLGIVAKFGKAFTWLNDAATGTRDLSKAQKFLKPAFEGLGKVFSSVGKGIITVIKGIGTAFMANPVLFAIAIIITAIVLLWENCAWFRDLVIGVWKAISSAAVTAWNWIKNTVVTVVHAIVSTATSVWQTLVSIWNTVTDAIASAVRWLWDNVIHPVWNVIASVASVVWSIVSGVVQTAVYIIVGIITVIAIIAKAVWDAIAAAATFLWNNILAPIFWSIKNTAVAVWTAVSAAAAAVWNAIQVGWNWLWVNILQPLFLLIQTAASMVWFAITASATAVWNGISAGWTWLVGFLSPIFSGIGSAGSAVWRVISDVANGVVGIIRGAWDGLGKFFSGLWDGISKAGTAAWEGIGVAIGKVTSVVSGVWDKITGAIKAVWNFIAKGWNSIPSIHVPDWVPVIGGSDFGLPKLPVLWHGGEAPGGRALVGEHGPEPLVVNGQLAGIVGTRGPEVAPIPRGGYVVPNLNTLNALPGLAKSLPPSVAAAVARSVPGYAGALSGSSGARSDGLAQAVNRLAGAVAGQMPPVTINGNGDVRGEALEAWKTFKREQDAHGRYDYSAGRG